MQKSVTSLRPLSGSIPLKLFSDIEVGHGKHRSHASAGECSRETVGVDEERCDLPEAALGKHSREEVLSNKEVGRHGLQSPEAALGKHSSEAVL
eukprot:2694815-Amphidinium_carterae.1